MAGGVKTPEQKARDAIDQQLLQAGWLIQNRDEINLSAGRGIAIREFKMADGYGFADYILYLERQAVGALEAKPAGFTLSGVKPQVDKYSEGLPANLSALIRPLPFLYVSTGIETSFANLLDPQARSRRVFSFHRPDTIAEWLQSPSLPEWVRGWRAGSEVGQAFQPVILPPLPEDRAGRSRPGAFNCIVVANA